MYPRIRDLREDMDLSQAKVAKMLGMSQTGYSKYETGENDIPADIPIGKSRYLINLIFNDKLGFIGEQWRKIKPLVDYSSVTRKLVPPSLAREGLRKA